MTFIMFPDSGKMLRDLRAGFITGIAILAPLAVTVFVVTFLVTRVGAPAGQIIFQNLFDEFPNQNSPAWWVINIVATIVVFIFITGVGFLSRYFFGKFILNVGERLINLMPLVNTVYKTVKQIVDTFSEQQKAIFQKVVLIQYPKEGTYAIAFLTSDAKGEIQARTGKEVVNVFLPTTPNPTSGFLLMVPIEEVIELEMSIGDGMKLIISGGAVSPKYPKPPAEPKNGNHKRHGLRFNERQTDADSQASLSSKNG